MKMVKCLPEFEYFYNPFLVYCRELAPGTVSLTRGRAQGDDSKHDSHYTVFLKNKNIIFKIRRSKVTDYAALNPCTIYRCHVLHFHADVLICMEGKKRHYSMHTSLFLYVGNFILFCKLCHHIMQIVI